MKTVVIGSGKLSIEDVVAIAKKQVAVELDSSAEFQRKIDSGAEFLDEALAEHGGIYGVTTGYGDSCTQVLPPEHYSQLPINLTRFHGCGLGGAFEYACARFLGRELCAFENHYAVFAERHFTANSAGRFRGRKWRLDSAFVFGGGCDW